MNKPKIKKHDYLFLPLIKLLPMSVTPNDISWLRIILALPFMVLIFTHNFKVAGILYLCIGIMDALDGSMARLRNQETKFGKIFDPTADKIDNIIGFFAFLEFVVSQVYTGLILVLTTIELGLFCTAAFKYLVKDIEPHLRPDHWVFDWIDHQTFQSIEIKNTGANNWGKAKMVSEVITLFFLLFFNPETSFRIHERFGFLPEKLTLLHLSFPMLIICIFLAIMSLKGHLQTIKFNGNGN